MLAELGEGLADAGAAALEGDPLGTLLCVGEQLAVTARTTKALKRRSMRGEVSAHVLKPQAHSCCAWAIGSGAHCVAFGVVPDGFPSVEQVHLPFSHAKS